MFELVTRRAEKRRQPICFVTYRFCGDALSSTFGSTSQFSVFDVVPNCSFQTAALRLCQVLVREADLEGVVGVGVAASPCSLLRTLFVCGFFFAV